ncbi:hypothetical protein NL108_008030 [Boleophthalmus pectinirostris]|nr:hypothetical protein NL108_008030 [Boleophthalmus pectinirostris]
MSEFSKVELLITNVMDKVFKISGCRHTPGSSDYLLFWRKALEKAIKHTDFECGIRQLFCLQWAIWLATQKYHIICETEKEISLLISTENKKGVLSESLLPVLEPKELIEILHVCTLIVQGAERFRDGQYSEALSDIEKATSFTAPRGVVACTHLLLGSCFHQMKCPQMALTCFRRALETDGHCVSALYQSMLVYRQLGNKQAEIQALELLHSVLNLTHSSECNTGDGLLVSSELLLSSSSLKNLLEVPSAPTVLHILALQCVRFGRVSEGVEHYLDLLAILHTGQPNPHHMNMDIPFLPHLSVLYLEAAAAMLMVQRPADCIALCDEVVNTTLDLLPQRLVLEELSVENEPSTPAVDYDDKGAMVLYVGASNLLKGHCYMLLKEWKQAMTHYTRCLDLLLRVRFKIKGCQPQIPSTDMVGKEGSKLFTVQRLKALSLAGRGICFAQTDRLKESLRDLHLSLHAFPECVNAGLWCGEVLWRLQRRHEAASSWKKTWGFTSESSNESVCVYLVEPPTDHMLNPMELQQRIEDLGFEDDRNA